MAKYTIIYKKGLWTRKFKTRAFNYRGAFENYFKKHDEEIIKVIEEEE